MNEQFLVTVYLPGWLLAVLAVAFMAQMLIAWVPATSSETNGWHTGKLHALGGVVVASAMVIFLWALAVFGSFSKDWQRPTAFWLAAICSLLYGLLLVLLYRSSRQLLLVESLFIATFSAGMLIFTWL